MKTYKDIYQLPLSNYYGRVHDAKDNFVFQFETDNGQRQDFLLGIINGTIPNTMTAKHKHENGIISNESEPLILIRGWGNLTGTGGHNLSAEEAANIQDTFAEFIVERLNDNITGKQFDNTKNEGV